MKKRPYSIPKAYDACMATLRDYERLLHMLEAHYNLLLAQWHLNRHRIIGKEGVDMMLGATVELMAERLRPVMEAADFRDVDCSYDMKLIVGLIALLRGITQGGDCWEDPFARVPEEMADALKIAPSDSKRKQYRRVLKKELARHKNAPQG